ncbi:MAG: DUF1611 domain-containing protein [Chroococcales cyanobacterium]
MRLTNSDRIAVLLHQGIQGPHGKTGIAFLRYSEAEIVAVIDQDSAGESLPELTRIPKDIPIVASVQDAFNYNPTVLLIGIAPSGGRLPDAWREEVKAALAQGISVINGLHSPMAALAETLQEGQWIWDIRQEPKGLGIGGARARSLSCQRFLTVGTDMAIGKMSTSLELYRAALKQGINAKFVATGQAGIMISGDGIPLDAIRVDFAAGAVEQMVMKYGQDAEIVFVEGQGSFFHPGSTATLPLIRGSQPTGLILVHKAGQKHIRDFPNILIPSLSKAVEVYETVASGAGAFGEVKVKGIALNTFHLNAEEAKKAIAQVTEETGLPCSDVVRFGGESLLDAVLKD